MKKKEKRMILILLIILIIAIVIFVVSKNTNKKINTNVDFMILCAWFFIFRTQIAHNLVFFD